MTKNNEGNTKERIQQTALNMFSKRGYEAVSIRDICKEVGIKESTVYYHFKNKQDILDSILNCVSELTETTINRFDSVMAKANNIAEEAFCLVAVNILDGYLLNTYVYKVITMLTIEKMSSKKADVLYRQLVFEGPLNQQTKVFKMLMDKGFIKEGNPQELADWYYSIIFFTFQRYYLGCEITEDTHVKACAEIKTHIALFYQNLFGGESDESIQK